jgi:PST family polysaccharide transporter
MKALSLLSLIGMLVSVIMTINGRDIVLFLLGPQWHKTGIIFSALGPAIGITVIYGTIGWLHLSQGNPGRWLKWGIVAFLFTALSLIAGLPFGALGVAIAYSLSFYFLTWPGIWYAAKPVGIRVRSVWMSIWRFFVAALVSGPATWWAANKVPTIVRFMEHVHVLVRIGLTTVLCTLLYLVSVIVLYGSIEPLFEMGRLLRMMMPGSRKEKAAKQVSREEES